MPCLNATGAGEDFSDDRSCPGAQSLKSGNTLNINPTLGLSKTPFRCRGSHSGDEHGTIVACKPGCRQRVKSLSKEHPAQVNKRGGVERYGLKWRQEGTVEISTVSRHFRSGPLPQG